MFPIRLYKKKSSCPPNSDDNRVSRRQQERRQKIEEKFQQSRRQRSSSSPPCVIEREKCDAQTCVSILNQNLTPLNVELVETIRNIYQNLAHKDLLTIGRNLSRNGWSRLLSIFRTFELNWVRSFCFKKTDLDTLDWVLALFISESERNGDCEEDEVDETDINDNMSDESKTKEEKGLLQENEIQDFALWLECVSRNALNDDTWNIMRNTCYIFRYSTIRFHIPLKQIALLYLEIWANQKDQVFVFSNGHSSVPYFLTQLWASMNSLDWIVSETHACAFWTCLLKSIHVLNKNSFMNEHATLLFRALSNQRLVNFLKIDERWSIVLEIITWCDQDFPDTDSFVSLVHLINLTIGPFKMSDWDPVRFHKTFPQAHRCYDAFSILRNKLPEDSHDSRSVFTRLMFLCQKQPNTKTQIQ